MAVAHSSCLFLIKIFSQSCLFFICVTQSIRQFDIINMDLVKSKQYLPNLLYILTLFILRISLVSGEYVWTGTEWKWQEATETESGEGSGANHDKLDEDEDSVNSLFLPDPHFDDKEPKNKITEEDDFILILEAPMDKKHNPRFVKVVLPSTNNATTTNANNKHQVFLSSCSKIEGNIVPLTLTFFLYYLF